MSSSESFSKGTVAETGVGALDAKREAIRKNVESAQKNSSLAPKSANPKQQSTHYNCTGRAPLHVAAANGHLEVVMLLVSHGADLNARS